MGLPEVSEMKSKTVAMLVLAVVGALIITAGGAYAMGRQTNSQVGNYPGYAYGSGMGPSMMGSGSGHRGMMGGYGTMDELNGT